MVGKKSDLFGNTAAAVRKLIDSSGAQDEYFLEYITASPGPVPRFTSDLSKIRAGLVYKPKGRTALIDAIYLALAATKDARYSRRALVILSDGMDNGSSRNWEDLHREFDDASVPIFLLVPFESWSGPTAGPIEWSMRKRLVDFVDESGGICAAATGSREIAEKMASLAALVRQPYSLVLPGPQQSVSQHAHLDLRIDVIGLKAPALPLYRSVRVRQVPAGQDRDR
jgi:Ca-activated chloride channel family protein